MLGSLPKLFDRNFAIGFLLPAMFGLIAIAWLFPELAVLAPLRSLGASEASLGGFTYLVLLVYGFAILLMVTNMIQYRLLEGYLWPLSRWTWSRDRQTTARNKIAVEYQLLLGRWKTEGDAFPRKDLLRANKLKKRLINNYPPLDQEAMPTRFGNIIRAFESYPLEAYGADGVPTWLRLASVVPKEFAAEIQDARAQVNFLLNLIYIIALVVIASFAKALFETPWEAVGPGGPPVGPIHPAAIVGIVGALLVPLAYSLILARARAWGNVVEAAFDCYLPALTAQLGYQAPASDSARRALWREINALISYRQKMNARHYVIAAPAAPAAPAALPTGPASPTGPAPPRRNSPDEGDHEQGEEE